MKVMMFLPGVFYGTEFFVAVGFQDSATGSGLGSI
jgi:hypothetical protein